MRALILAIFLSGCSFQKYMVRDCIHLTPPEFSDYTLVPYPCDLPSSSGCHKECRPAINHCEVALARLNDSRLFDQKNLGDLAQQVKEQCP